MEVGLSPTQIPHLAAVMCSPITVKLSLSRLGTLQFNMTTAHNASLLTL